MSEARLDKREPWSKFYWADWRANKELRLCGLAARGLWMEMLCLMHEATPYGHLLINGLIPTLQQLAVQVGAPAPAVRKAMLELETAGVATITEGVWISRRMMRDARRRAVNQANGSSGGNPKLKDKPADNQQTAKLDNQNATTRITEPDKPADKSHDARDPDARSQIPEARGGSKSSGLSIAAREAEPGDLVIPPILRAKTLHPQAMEILRGCVDASPDWIGFAGLKAMLETGATEVEILDACRAAADQKTSHPLRSWGYIASTVETNQTRKQAHDEAQQTETQRSQERVDRIVARRLARPEPGLVDGP